MEDINTITTITRPLTELVSLLSKYKTALLLVFSVGFFCISFYVYNNHSQVNNDTANVMPQANPIGATLTIDVAGAVAKPGVYQLPVSARVQDAITSAGGFDQATVDRDFVAKEINLAAKLSDGQKIYILHHNENRANISPYALGSALAMPEKVNVNTATLEQIETLPSITATSANKIIVNRPYQSIQDLLSKKAISATSFSKEQQNIIAS